MGVMLPIIRTCRENAALSRWVQAALDSNSSLDDVEQRAKGLLQEAQNLKVSTSSKRFRFEQATKREELLTLLFERSFKDNFSEITQDAQNLHPQKTAFYPRWKRICWIHIPKGTALFFGNIVVQLVVTAVSMYFFWKTGNKAYHQTVHFCSARALPFIINNTPIKIIRAGNVLLKGKDWVQANRYKILIGGYIGQFIVSNGPNIPYITSFIKSINIYNIIFGSQSTLFGFLLGQSFAILRFVPSQCSQVSLFFRDVAQRNEEERYAVCRQKSLEVWRTLIIQNTPEG
jgi:hypothetical protein